MDVFIDVGALTERPARKCYEFAETSGEFARYYRRAVTDRPYIVIIKCTFFDTLKPEHISAPVCW